MSEKNKAFVRRFYAEVINAGRLELIDELMTADFIDHEELPGLEPNRSGVKQFFVALRQAFPDLQMKVEDLIAEGDKVAARVTMSGTQRSEFLGIPSSGKRFEVTVVDIMRIVDGKAAEHWGAADTGAMMAQLSGG